MAGYFSGFHLIDDSIQIRTQPIEKGGERLPQVFLKNGYDTSFFSANPNTGSYYRGARGFKHIIQPKPASHFPFYDFVLARFLKYASNLPKRVQFNNNKERLSWYQKELNVYGVNGLKSAMLDPKNEKMQGYRKQLESLLSDHDNLKVAVELPHQVIKTVFYPLSNFVFENVLKWTFISPSLSSGRVVVDHWLADYELVDEFKQWFEGKRNKNKPFFAHLQFMGPHNPYQEQPPYLKPHFDPHSKFDREMPPAKHLLPSQGAPKLPDAELHNMMANYDDAIRITDANIEKLISYLERKRVLDNTIVVFVSDHGEAFYEHKIYDHMYSLYSELVDIPLFIYWKDHLKPRRTNVPVSLIDLYPTLLELTGLEKDGNVALEGTALLSPQGGVLETQRENRVRHGSVWLGMKPEPMKWIVNEFNQWNKPGHQPLQAFHRMVVKGDHKWVHEIEGDSIFGSASKKERVFHFDRRESFEYLVPLLQDSPQIKQASELFPELPKGITSRFFN